jgi:hypothetical protein
MKLLIAHVSEDGYMYGAGWADDGAGAGRYWHLATDECEPCFLESIDIPDNLDAWPWLAQGTSDQEFSDGYEAWSAIQRYRHGITL